MLLSRRTALTLVSAAAAAHFARPALARQPQVYAEAGVAIDGTDPVSYFRDGRPVPGRPEHALDWNGARWLFASAGTRAAFREEPARFAPRYGGYCAYAMSKGHVAPTVPEAWSIVDDRLYLNFSLDVREIWKQDIAGNIRAADANWPGALEI